MYLATQCASHRMGFLKTRREITQYFLPRLEILPPPSTTARTIQPQKVQKIEGYLTTQPPEYITPTLVEQIIPRIIKFTGLGHQVNKQLHIPEDNIRRPTHRSNITT